MSIPQTSYTDVPRVGRPGQIWGSGPKEIASYEAEEAIPPGRVVELGTNGKCRLPQTASAVGKLLGVSLYEDTQLPDATGYPVGAMVSVLRKGTIFAEFTGTTDAEQATPNVKSSSTVATDRGKFTDAATSASAGVEVYAFPRGVFFKPQTDSALCLVEVNLP